MYDRCGLSPLSLTLRPFRPRAQSPLPLIHTHACTHSNTRTSVSLISISSSLQPDRMWTLSLSVVAALSLFCGAPTASASKLPSIEIAPGVEMPIVGEGQARGVCVCVRDGRGRREGGSADRDAPMAPLQERRTSTAPVADGSLPLSATAALLRSEKGGRKEREMGRDQSITHSQGKRGDIFTALNVDPNDRRQGKLNF